MVVKTGFVHGSSCSGGGVQSWHLPVTLLLLHHGWLVEALEVGGDLGGASHGCRENSLLGEVLCLHHFSISFLEFLIVCL